MKRGEWLLKGPWNFSIKAHVFYWPTVVSLIVAIIIGVDAWLNFDGSFQINQSVFPVFLVLFLFFVSKYRIVVKKETESYTKAPRK